MPLGQFGTPPSADISTKDLADLVGRLLKEVQYLLNGGLDSLNVPSLVASYISTADGTYPRIDFSSTNNLLAAYQDANDYMAIYPLISGQNAPGIMFYANGQPLCSIVYINGSGLLISTQGVGAGPITISPAGDLNLGSAANILLNTTGNLKINNLAGYTGSFSVVTGVNFTNQTTTSKTVTVTKGIITSVV
jgi:hypothetical protein